MAVIFRGRCAAIRAEHDRQRMVAYEMARWAGFSFHDPKNLPKFELLSEKTAAEADAQAAVNDAMVRGWFIAMSMREH